jgi:hypothetical protein
VFMQSRTRRRQKQPVPSAASCKIGIKFDKFKVEAIQFEKLMSQQAQEE